LGFADDLANYVCFENRASIWNQDVDVLDDVNKDLVVPVLYSFSAPRNASSSLNGYLLKFFDVHTLGCVSFSLRNIHFKQVGI
jgi:hypothetical protein